MVRLGSCVPTLAISYFLLCTGLSQQFPSEKKTQKTLDVIICSRVCSWIQPMSRLTLSIQDIPPTLSQGVMQHISLVSCYEKQSCARLHSAQPSHYSRHCELEYDDEQYILDTKESPQEGMLLLYSCSHYILGRIVSSVLMVLWGL